jgi:hypothetical protein
VLSQKYLTLIEDGNKANLIRSPGAGECGVALVGASEPDTYRSLVVADLLQGGEDEVVVGVPNPAPGKVVIFKRTDMEFPCIKPIASPTPEARRFGASLAFAGKNAQGKSVLLVGAPPGSVFAYGIDADGTVEMLRDIKPPDVGSGSASGDFGFRVAALDLDGKPGVEIAISAPDLSVNGKSNAGKVYIFRNDFSFVAGVADKSPDEDSSFGFTLNQVEFISPCGGSTHKLLVVGAVGEVFTYFRLPEITTADPRCFGSAM